MICDCVKGHNGLGMATRECDCRYNTPSDQQIEEAWVAAAEALDDAISDPETSDERIKHLEREFTTLDDIRSSRQADGDYSG